MKARERLGWQRELIEEKRGRRTHSTCSERCSASIAPISRTNVTTPEFHFFSSAHAEVVVAGGTWKMGRGREAFGGMRFPVWGGEGARGVSWQRGRRYERSPLCRLAAARPPREHVPTVVVGRRPREASPLGREKKVAWLPDKASRKESWLLGLVAIVRASSTRRVRDETVPLI